MLWASQKREAKQMQKKKKECPTQRSARFQKVPEVNCIPECQAFSKSPQVRGSYWIEFWKCNIFQISWDHVFQVFKVKCLLLINFHTTQPSPPFLCPQVYLFCTFFLWLPTLSPVENLLGCWVRTGLSPPAKKDSYSWTCQGLCYRNERYFSVFRRWDYNI